MRIVFLTVSTNYHMPLVLRDIFPRLGGDELRVVVSTKGDYWNPRRVLRRYGLKYTTWKALERITFASLVWRERRRGLKLGERRFLRIFEVLEAAGIDPLVTPDIHAPECIHQIQDYRPDMLISAYFDQILRPPLLHVSTRPPVNLHPSLLPAYAGSAPTFWVLANGEKQTGITIHEMTENVDRGPILFQKIIPIEPDDTQFSLYRRCTLSYLEPLLDIIDACRHGRKTSPAPVPQNVTPSYYSKVTKADVERFLARGRRFIGLSLPP